jgi:ribulose-phosphate 3-epimerase
MVLIMSVNPGFGGQKFIPEVLVKISQMQDMIRERKLDIEIEVDGGVNVDNVADTGRAVILLLWGMLFTIQKIMKKQ